jgi:UDP-N-acetylglucosamine 2-epimerase (non-hydrolysing)
MTNNRNSSFVNRHSKVRCLFVFGTRPEAIKLAPVISEFRRRCAFSTAICLTGQHALLLDQVLSVFRLRPDYELKVMKKGQSLFDVTARTLERIEPVLKSAHPDIVFVQGDTTSAFAAALAAFYRGIALAHVEAGLRTYDLTAPFPEELNRRLIAPIARFNFPPTADGRRHLRSERVSPSSIFVTGNTVVDALLEVARRPATAAVKRIVPPNPFILVTMHRRESFGAPMRSVFRALLEITRRHPEISIVYPVHPNPNVAQPARELLGRNAQVRLLPPLEYVPFVYLLEHCVLVLSDSGGVQEEAPVLGKPVLVLRDKTERPEAIRAGTARLVGTDPDRIVRETSRLLGSPTARRCMMRQRFVFGDGRAARRIADYLEYRYGLRRRPPREFRA